MKKIFIILILLPLISFSQNAIIKNLYPVNKHQGSNDSIKAICYPIIYSSTGIPYTRVNNKIKAYFFNTKDYDTSKPAAKLLQKLYKKDPSLKIDYKISHNRNGLLSLIITIISINGDKKPPLYLNYDFIKGDFFTLKDLLNTKNDSVSMRQAIVPQMADSIRLIEEKLDKNNPNYSDIIEQLNSEIGTFSHAYPVSFVLADTEMVFYLDCFLPSGLFNYTHTYKVKFPFKTLKNVLKKAIVTRLQ